MFNNYCYLCFFQYLGCIEVFESRGVHVCEEAFKELRVITLQKKEKINTKFPGAITSNTFNLHSRQGEGQYAAPC